MRVRTLILGALAVAAYARLLREPIRTWREEGGRTRLISRNRFRLPGLKAKLGMLPMEPASLVMERKMLVGIRERAEKLADGDTRSATRPLAG